jgi:hypothetical protein
MPALVELPGKGLLEFLDEFRQGRPFLPPRLGLLFGKIAVLAVFAPIPNLQFLIGNMILRKYADQQMEMVVHQAKAKNFSEINSGKGLEAGKKIILIDSIERKTGQRSPGHHMINRGTVGNQQAGKTGHGHLHA